MGSAKFRQTFNLEDFIRPSRQCWQNAHHWLFKRGVVLISNELDKDPKTVSKMFDDISPTYDVLNHILSMSVDVGWRNQALDELSPGQGEVILDIATGTGDMALLAHKRTGCEVVGVDISRKMIEVAVNKWSERYPGDGYSAIEGDALHLPFPDGTFGSAMVAFGIRNMVEMGSFLDEVRRVLKKDGRLAILEFSVPSYPVVKQIYLAYLTKMLPFIGGLQSGNRTAYDYLSHSIRKFPSPSSMEQLFEEHGFIVKRSIPQTMGISHLYVLGK
ncbi:MAG: ubiquinone/menaquinone biosynthesis methyltransferase [Methanomassiliicoccales archaeon PtaU1.Bin124]|nr:MAG: ubiquinone/menaquinone biosynthesis methyltransferase [Methanomassiliicoccales archaeon PtaU1.Bin124]